MLYTNLINLVDALNIGCWDAFNDDAVIMERNGLEFSIQRNPNWGDEYRLNVYDIAAGEGFEVWFKSLERALSQAVAYSQGDILRIDGGRESFGLMEADWFFFDFEEDGHKITALHSNDPVMYRVCGVRAYKRDWGWELVSTVTGTRNAFVPAADSSRYFIWDGELF
jgi:hypothetical protein